MADTTPTQNTNTTNLQYKNTQNTLLALFAQSTPNPKLLRTSHFEGEVALLSLFGNGVYLAHVTTQHIQNVSKTYFT